MNLSSLSGESLAAVLPQSADFLSYSLSSAGVVVNFSGSGLFGISFGSTGDTIRLTVDGVQLADMTADELKLGLGVNTISDKFIFKSSLKVEVITHTTGTVTVQILGA